MKKLLLVLMAVGLTSCATALANTPYDDSRGDPQAEYAQSLMKNAVKFEETISVEADPKMLGLPNITFDVRYVGSGVVVDRNDGNGKSLIMTAWHVCDHMVVGTTKEDKVATYKILKDKQQIITVTEEKLDFRVLYRNKNTDTCVVETSHTFPSEAVLADQMPPRGAYVSVVGAPEGNWGEYLVSMEDGRYFGLTTIRVPLADDDEPTVMKDFAYYGTAGVGGYSGSAVYYRGELIGLHTAGSTDYEHASYGPPVNYLKDALEEAKKKR